MLLEQKITEVSNRYFSIEDAITTVQKIVSPLELMKSNPSEDEPRPEEAELKNDDLLSTPTTASLDYSFADEHFSGEFYNTPRVDYEKLFADEKKIKKESEEYDTSSDNNPETMSMEEAEEMTERYQFAVVLGVLGDINYVERRRFATWADFNPVERELFHRQYAMTNDVNYSKAF